jgi:hypothetical protein
MSKAKLNKGEKTFLKALSLENSNRNWLRNVKIL